MEGEGGFFRHPNLRKTTKLIGDLEIAMLIRLCVHVDNPFLGDHFLPLQVGIALREAYEAIWVLVEEGCVRFVKFRPELCSSILLS